MVTIALMRRKRPTQIHYLFTIGGAALPPKAPTKALIEPF